MEHFSSTLTYALRIYGPSPRGVRVDMTIALTAWTIRFRDTPKSRRLERVTFTRNKLKPSASASTRKPDATGACKHNKLNGFLYFATETSYGNGHASALPDGGSPQVG